MASEHPQFDYWHRVLDLEHLFLQSLLSQREQKYISHIPSLTKIMFTLDHYNYARWLTVHVNDPISIGKQQSLWMVDAIKSTEDIGEAQYHTFLKERLYNNTIDFSDTILKNNLSLLCSATQKKTAKYTSNLSNLNDNISLFSRMYVSCQARGSDMDTFFKHENHAWPPSLASNGIMHQTKEFDLMECLESLAPQPDNIPDVDVGIIDIAALVWVWNMDAIWSWNKEALYPMPTHFTSVRIWCSLEITTTAWVFWVRYCLAWTVWHNIIWLYYLPDCHMRYVRCPLLTWSKWKDLLFHCTSEHPLSIKWMKLDLICSLKTGRWIIFHRHSMPSTNTWKGSSWPNLGTVSGS